MTPQLPVQQRNLIDFRGRQIAAILLGALLLLAGTSYLVSAPVPGNPWAGIQVSEGWLAGLMVALRVVRGLSILLLGGLAVAIAGAGIMVAAVCCYFGWTLKAARQAVAAALFLPGLWLIVTFVRAIPDSSFEWRLLGLPLAFLIRWVAYRVADLLARRSSP